MPLPARFSQADIARAIRAIEGRDGWRLRILPDGSMVIEKEDQAEPTPKRPLAAREGFRL